MAFFCALLFGTLSGNYQTLMEPYIQKLTLKNWADDDKPREKLLLKGRHSLSDAELIAITLGSGTTDQTAVELAREILSSVSNSLHLLGKLSVADLCKFKGIGEAKAIALIAALELGRRRSDTLPPDRPKVLTSADAFHQFAPVLNDLSHEEFWILLLNRANDIEDRILISKGGLTGTIVDSRIIFKTAIEKLATGIVLGHNHPSGQTVPSEADLLLTKRLCAAGKILDIQVVDHIIIANNRYYSFADDGKL